MVIQADDFDRSKKIIMHKHRLSEKQFWEWMRVKENYSKLVASCRRYMPDPEITLARLEWLHKTLAKSPDAETGKPLFNAKADKAWRQLLKHVKAGCLSDPDPAEISLYFLVGRTKEGLPIFGCVRGTNDIEGYHQKVKGMLAGWNNSPEVSE